MQMASNRAGEILGLGGVLPLYSALMLLSGFGLLSFWLFRRLFPSIYSRQFIAALAVSFCIVGSLGMVLTHRPTPFSIASGVTLFTLGYMGGGIHYGFSLAFRDSGVSGRSLGCGMGIAALLQAGVDALQTTEVAFVASLTLSCFVMFWFGMRPLKDWMYERPLVREMMGVADNKALIVTLCVATCLMTLDYGVLDSVLIWEDVAGRLSLAYAPSIVYGATLPLVGVLFDLNGGGIRSLVTVCAMSLTTVATTAAALPGGMDAASVISGIYGAFYTMFVSALFIRVAPRAREPELVAGLGMAISSVVSAASALVAHPLFLSCGPIVASIASCVLSTAVLLVLIREIARGVLGSDEPADEEKHDETVPTREESAMLYAREHDLTPRETDVLVALLTTELGVQEIADGLFVSRRVAQRHIASIYEKTGAQSRIGLYQRLDAFREGLPNN